MRFLVFLIFIPFCIFPQSGPVQQISTLYMPQGIVMQPLANNGGKSTKSIISEIGASNPASLYDFTKISAGLSYQFDTKIKEAWLFDYSRNRINNYIPQSVGVVIPEDDWRFAITLNQIYNNEIDYGILDATMVWQDPQGYMDIEEINPKRRETILSTSVISSYTINNLIKKDDNLIVGLQANFNFLEYELIMTKSDKFRENTNAFTFTTGIIYEFAGDSFPKSRIGLYYESKLDLSKTFNHNSSRYEIIGILPHKLHLGVYHPCGEQWSYYANISYLFWNDVNQIFKDQTELSARATYRISRKFEISFGFFSSDKKYKENNSMFRFDNLEVIYLILSADYMVNDFKFNISFGHSRLLSDTWRKNTLFKLGAGFNF